MDESEPRPQIGDMVDGLEAVAIHALEQAKGFEGLAAVERDAIRLATLEDWRRQWLALSDDMAKAVGRLTVLSACCQKFRFDGR